MKIDNVLPKEALKVFETVPELYLILSPDFRILTATNIFLKSTNNKREDIQGKYIKELFSGKHIFSNDGIQKLHHSLEWVSINKIPHQVGIAQEEVQDPGRDDFDIKKYWKVTNTPVLNDDGSVHYIILKVHAFSDGIMSLNEGLEVQIFFEKQEQIKAEVFAARAEINLRQEKLYNILMEAPAMICIFEGPQHVFKLVNPLYQQLVGDRPILGKPIAEAMPELAGQPIFDLLDHVYKTGESFYAQEMKVQLDHENTGNVGQNYYNFTYQAIHNSDGSIDGIFVFAYEVTVQVEARKKVEQREQALKELNEKLSAANEEITASNEELSQTQGALQDLNTELEERVKSRTEELSSAKVEIENQRNRLYDLFMQASSPICILDGEQFIYELVNPAYQELLPNRKLLGVSLLEGALLELSSQPFVNVLRKVYKTGETFNNKEQLIQLAPYEGATPEDRYFDYTLQARRNQKGEVDGIIIFFHEVTAQVEARKIIEKSAKQLQLITDAMPAAITFVDHNKRYRFVNKLVQQWRGDIIGRTMEEVLGKKTFDEIEHYVEQALGGEKVRYNAHLLYSDGYRHVQIDFVPQWEERKVKGFYTLIVDITSQVEARLKIEEREKEAHALAEELRAANEDLSRSNEAFRKLNQQQQQLVALVENSTDFIGLASPEGQGVFINQAGLELVGLEKSQIKELKVLDFFYEEDKSFVNDTILTTAKNKGSWVGEFTIRHFTTGRPIPIYYNCFSIKDPSSGQLLGIATIFIDITERKKQEEELHGLTRRLARANSELSEANDQLIRTNVDLDNFIYTASHDLKAPISNIEGLLLVLLRSLNKEDLVTGNINYITSLMQNSIDRFKKTISNLTEVVKLQKDNNQSILPLTLFDIINDVLLDLNQIIESTGAQFEINVGDCPFISFSEKNLRSIVYNLISNAIKYRSPERAPFIKLHCFQAEGYIVFSIEDNGLGMELRNESKLFGMFSRLHDHVEGSGIGLYMVRKIIENAGGKIEVESQVNVGSTFKVYFKS